MLEAEPGWISERPWEFWRGRLTLATGRAILEALPRRSFDAAIIDRAEAKDYRDIAVMLSAGISLEKALGAFAKMYGKDPGLPLRAMGFFKDGDLASLSKSDQDILRKGERSCFRNS